MNRFGGEKTKVLNSMFLIVFGILFYLMVGQEENLEWIFKIIQPILIAFSIAYVLEPLVKLLCNKFKLKRANLESKVHEINYKGIEISKKASCDKVLVFGSIGPTGEFMEPLGSIKEIEMIECFADQVKAFSKAKAVHTLFNNAAIIMGLLYGDGDFIQSVRISTECGADTDCNAGNAGAILGAYLGQNLIPSYAKRFIRGEIIPGLKEWSDKSIQNLSQRTFTQALRFEELRK